MASHYQFSFGEFIFRMFSDGFVKKGLFGKPSVVRGASIFGGVIVFQSAALLGRARANDDDALGKLLKLSIGRPATSMGSALDGLAEGWRGRLTRQPNTIMDVWMGCEFPSIDLADMRILKHLAGTDSNLEAVLKRVEWGATLGVAYGRRYPDELVQLWRHSYEQVMDQASWDSARAAGLDIPTQQEIQPLADAETLVLQQTSAYAHAYRPELVEPLQLPRQ